MDKIINFFKRRNVRVVSGMLFGTIIYCLGIVWIIDLGSFYAGGITGVSQVVTSIIEKFTSKSMPGLKSIFIAVLNLPLFLIGWKGVSKRFAILSLSSVAIQVVLIALLEKINFHPFADLSDDKLMLSILGGLVTGAGCGISLRAGSSTGGMDIISQYVSIKKNINFAKFSMTVDMIIIACGAVFGTIEVAVYTIIRLIISILVLDKIHTIYKYIRITIVTEEKQRMREILISRFNHGVTIYTGVGGYSNKTKYVFEIVISSYESEEYRNIIRKVDKTAFVTYTAVKQVDGSFNRNIIA